MGKVVRYFLPEREGIDLDGLTGKVVKVMGANPRKIEAIKIQFEHPSLKATEEQKENYIEEKSVGDLPYDKIFGLFTTIKRSQKLPKFPVDIHGCLGYWTDNYRQMTPQEIIKKLAELLLKFSQ